MEVFNSPGPYNTARLTGVLVDPRGKLHLAFLKWTLGINRKTSNAPIWDDCSRLPLVLKLMGQMFNYINRLQSIITQDMDCLVRPVQKTSNFGWFRKTSEFYRNMSNNDLASVLSTRGRVNVMLLESNIHKKFVDSWEDERNNNKKLLFDN